MALIDNTHITQPDIDFFGLRVMEPVTTLTDILVTAACFFAAWTIHKANIPGRTPYFLKWYLFGIGCAAFCGGIIGHAFLYAFDERWKLIGWFLSMVAVALFERASIQHARPHMNRIWGEVFLWINIIELITFMAITAITLDFWYVQVHSAYGLLVVVFSFNLFAYSKAKDATSKYLLYTVGLMAIAAVIFNYPVVLHEWFNHRDFAHILMATSALVTMKGALELRRGN